MTAAEFVEYAAKNHVNFELPEDNREFKMQVCQDEKLTMSFRKLHEDVVNMIIKWCHDNDVIIDEFSLNADGLPESIESGSWQSCTDSGLSFYKFDDRYKKIYHYADIDYIKSLTKKDIDNITYENHEPYLFSM